MKYKLKTKALTNRGKSHNVYLIVSSQFSETDETSLHIENTPGCWFMESLLSGGLEHNELSIDFGARWSCINRSDLIREAVNICIDNSLPVSNDYGYITQARREKKISGVLKNSLLFR